MRPFPPEHFNKMDARASNHLSNWVLTKWNSFFCRWSYSDWVYTSVSVNSDGFTSTSVNDCKLFTSLQNKMNARAEKHLSSWVFDKIIIQGKAILAVMKQLKQWKQWLLTGFEPMTSDTGAMLYQLRYEASLEAGQVRVQFIPLYEENDMMWIWYWSYECTADKEYK